MTTMYMGFKITTNRTAENVVATAVKGKVVIQSKKISGTSAERRTISHCKRMIEQRHG